MLRLFGTRKKEETDPQKETVDEIRKATEVLSRAIKNAKPNGLTVGFEFDFDAADPLKLEVLKIQKLYDSSQKD